MKDPYIRRCALLRVIDGDTLRLHVDLGWNVFSDHNVRLLRVNAPEMKGDTLAAGQAAKAWVVQWLTEHGSAAVWPYVIHSEKDDAFGRYLVELYDANDVNLNDDLLASGNAVPYVR